MEMETLVSNCIIYARDHLRNGNVGHELIQL